MTERAQLESLFLAHQGVIERTVRLLCRRHGITGADADDAASLIRLKLVENDYAILRKFRGESALPTYLTVVIAMLFRDYRVERWGRWRPSAGAQRKGPLAVRLEALLHRDRLSLREATEVLRSSGATDLTSGEVRDLMASLPSRAPLRPLEVDQEVMDTIPTSGSAEAAVVEQVSEEERRAAHAAVHNAMEALPAEDRVILKLHYWEGLTIANVARAIGLPPKPLYKRIERAEARVRERLEAAGVSRDIVRELLAGADS